MRLINDNMINILLLKNGLAKPKIYEKTADKFWDDDHISEQLLNIHLDPDVESASKKRETIEAEADFIIKATGMRDGKYVLDLGCGPGLYVQKFAETGAIVTGIDLSWRSIEYANKTIKPEYPNIRFIKSNYLDLDYDNSFDIATLIYYDFCVLSDDEQRILLSKTHKALKPGGFFILDVITENMDIPLTTNIAVVEGGFWSAKPYIEIQQSFLYDDPKTIGQQYMIIEEDGDTRIIRFYNRLFTLPEIEEMLIGNGFEIKEICADLKGEPLSSDSKTYGIVAIKG
jgi:SAM-dependent methyltransferase